MHKKIKNFNSFVVFRTDRIGDTVLSAQVPELLKKYYPNSKIIFVVRNYTKAILQNNPFVDEIISIDEHSTHELVKILKSKKIDVSISLFASKEATILPFLARIPVRIGPMSKIRSLLFNLRIWQKRSQSRKNEAEYNLDLLKPLGINEICYPKIYLTQDEKSFGENYLKNLENLKNLEKNKLVILHPGSGGSSKDWSLDKYFKLAKMLIEKNIRILISGSKKELEIYEKYSEKYKIPQAFLMKNELEMREFFAVISSADLFVSNSTGPLHCAVALGVKTVSFYPPLKTCSALRWGPFSDAKNNHFVFTPNLPECKKCDDKCPNYLCMDSISEQTVFTKILEILNTNVNTNRG
jgi:ADP-heptose:LPS heptosyltransferase